jgi:YHS domain-containing protein
MRQNSRKGSNNMRRHFPAIVLILVLAVSVSAVAQAKKAEKAEKVKDPVCGIMVDKNPALSYTYKGETYYFCSKTDEEKFKQAPEKYAKK